MAIKLDRCKRWLPAKKYLKDEQDISVHFSNVHYNYYSAWKYVIKEDEEILESDNHPDLWNSKPPKTNAASCLKKTVSQKRERERSADSGEECDDHNSVIEEGVSEEKTKSRSQKRKKRLSSFELSEIIVEKGIQTRTELLAFANNQKVNGKFDIAEFIVNRGPRVVAEVLNTAWELRNAQGEVRQIKEVAH